ncbi:MAG: sugar O-acetyltransferase [Staphylococcus equorum]|uniref:sugar O-acetyltransferase n=1 Tax=Staphylococcus TaxID=1279 RepID=UPI00255224A0|nr:sugar O-acetyltransferase [Staphylococcus equorum]MDK9871300.1 sugar O-acetyltransferase [Staphylococcus equorum]MDK9877655.1 sugar O-acetyltransferase [Staphylococcus equorum]MDN5828439.1 sugar O-acetyltransferase [Staphylococcus equorum]MDN5907897.1 sugar O-acetyltransferase [Staphylococcus equorum]MDN6570242.1 sugar O-acetyltransferase [Staphylococcus equorum]
MSEKEKMLAGEWYDANFDEALDVERNKAKDLCFELNHTKPSNSEKRNAILTDLLNDKPDNLEILSPFQVDYGYNVFLGNNVFVNHDCYFMDGGKIFIGNHVWLGGNVVVLPGVTIGDGAVIGAGSLVAKDIPANVVAVGMPAKPISKIDN